MNIKGEQYEALPVTRYDIGTTAIYVGYAAKGALASAAAWTVKKITLDASGNPTASQWTAESRAVWDNRTSEVYT